MLQRPVAKKDSWGRIGAWRFGTSAGLASLTPLPSDSKTNETADFLNRTVRKSGVVMITNMLRWATCYDEQHATMTNMLR